MKINKGLILASFLAVAGINETQAQTTKQTNQELCENFSPKKNNTMIIRNKEDLPKEITDHKEFINTNVYELIMIYGKKRALELINQHMLIEINKFREENGKQPLKLDLEIQELSQERAEHLYNENLCDHGKGNDSLQTRIKQKNIKGVTDGGENISQGFNTVDAANNAFEISEIGHRDLLLKDECNFCGVGVKCSDLGNNDETGNTVFTGGGRYHESNKPFRIYWCITIVKKEEKPEKKE